MKKMVQWIITGGCIVVLVEIPRHLFKAVPHNKPWVFFKWSDFMDNLQDSWHRLISLSPGVDRFTGKPLSKVLTPYFLQTLQLIVIALTFVLIVGLLKGTFDAFAGRRHRIAATTSNLLQWLIESLPDVFVILSIELLGFYLTRLGSHVYFVGSHDLVTGTVVPAVILALLPTMYLSRVVRVAIDEQFGQQYVVTAVAKGLQRSRVIIRHIIPNTIPMIVNSLPTILAILFSNLVMIEYLFYRIGIVSGLLNAIDYSYFLPSREKVPLPSSSGRIYSNFDFDPNTVLFLLIGCVLLFFASIVIVRMLLRTMGFRSITPSNPYTDILRESSCFYRIPWQLWAGMLIVSVLIICGMFQEHLGLPAPYMLDTLHTSKGELSAPPFPPSYMHLLGTDPLGRDMLSQAIQGILPTYFYIGITTLVVATLGLLLGVMSSVWKVPIMRPIISVSNSIFKVMPSLIGALLILEIPDLYFMGGSSEGQSSWLHILIYLSTIGVIEVGRIAFNIQSYLEILSKKSFMEAAVIGGASKLSNLLIHYLRPLTSYFAEQTLILFNRLILLSVSLGFFGLAMTMVWSPSPTDGRYVIESVTHDWGGLIAENARYYMDVQWVFFAPILFLSVTIIALNLILRGVRIMSQTMPTNRQRPSIGFTFAVALLGNRRSFLKPYTKTKQQA